MYYCRVNKRYSSPIIKFIALVTLPHVQTCLTLFCGTQMLVTIDFYIFFYVPQKKESQVLEWQNDDWIFMFEWTIPLIYI